MRVAEVGNDSTFAEYLTRCGDGKLPVLDGKYRVKIPAPLKVDGELDKLIDWVFEGMTENCSNQLWVRNRAAICPSNKTVDIINHKVMEKFPGEQRVYLSYDSLDEDSHLYPLEYVHTLTPIGVPPHELRLITLYIQRFYNCMCVYTCIITLITNIFSCFRTYC